MSTAPPAPPAPLAGARERVARCLALDAVAIEVVAALDARGVPAVLLKGPATVRWLYRDDASARLYTDVDLLVAPADLAAAGATMSALGFRCRTAGLRPSEAASRYEEVWDRGPGEMVELHRGFYGVGDREVFWREVQSDVEPLDVLGRSVPAPGRRLAALVFALHAAQHGTERSLSAKPLEDLRRAVSVFAPELWARAAALADEVGAGAAFSAGLSLDPGGALLVDQLGLRRPLDPGVVVRLRGRERPGDRRIAELAAAPPWTRWRIARDIVLPSRSVLASRTPAVTGSRRALAAAYLRRWWTVSTGLPAGLLAWRRSVVGARRTGWTPAGRPVDRAVAAWWTVRALLAVRRQVAGTSPDALVLPQPPSVAERRPDLVGTVGVTSSLLGARCLASAAARQRWLSASGEPRDLVIGVTPPSSGFRAHAWLDGDRGHAGFAELTRYPAAGSRSGSGGRAGRLPDFVVIGAAKSGTTSLWAYLDAHPQVHMSRPKEPEFFNDEEHWRRGLDWYRGLFANAPADAVVGEASVRYATSRRDSRDVPARMAAVVPHAKLVYVVRDPVERMASQWRHNRARYAEPLTIEDALQLPRYRDVSSYATQLERFLQHFPASSVHVVVSERLRDDRAAELARLFEFLGVDPDVEPTGIERELNRGADQRLPRAVMVRALRRRPLRVAHRLLRRAAPAWLRTVVGRLTRQAAVPSALSPETRAELGAGLAEEVRRLRPYVSGPFDGWGLG